MGVFTWNNIVYKPALRLFGYSIRHIDQEPMSSSALVLTQPQSMTVYPDGFTFFNFLVFNFSFLFCFFLFFVFV